MSVELRFKTVDFKAFQSVQMKTLEKGKTVKSVVLNLHKEHMAASPNGSTVIVMSDGYPIATADWQDINVEGVRQGSMRETLDSLDEMFDIFPRRGE